MYCMMEQCTVRLSLGQGFDGTYSAEEDTVLYFLCKAQNSLLAHRTTRLGGYLTSPTISMREGRAFDLLDHNWKCVHQLTQFFFYYSAHEYENATNAIDFEFTNKCY